MNCNLQARLKVLSVEAETVALLQTMSETGSPEHIAAKERENLSFDDWSKRLQKYYSTLERLFSPDLIVVGGGVSKQWEEFLPKLNLNCEIVPALKRNNAGILGAAALAWKNSDDE